MADAPLLKANGALVFASPEAYRQHYQQYLVKGGALVRSESALTPLQVIRVRIALPSSEEVQLEAEVTSLAGALCLLHFVDVSADAANRLRRAASVGSPAVTPIPMLEPSPTPEALLREVAALVAQVPPEEQVPDRPPRPPPADAAPRPAPILLTAAVPSPAQAAVAPVPHGSPTPAPPMAAPTPAPPMVAGTPVPGTPIPAEALAPTPVPGAHAERAAAASTASAQLFKGERPFKNPTTPNDFLALPLLRPSQVDQAQPPSIPTVLQWLSLLKAQGLAIKLKSPRVREVAFWVVWGTDLRSGTGTEALVRALAEPDGTLEVSPCQDVPKMPYTVPLSSVRFAVLRELLKHFTEVDLTAAMSARMGMAPKLNAHGTSLLRVLGLSEPQLRMAHRLLGGEYTLDMVLHNGIGVRTTWQVLYLEQLLAGLAWVEPPHRQSAVVEEMRALMERIRGDHFSALGLHITSAPRAVERAYERLKREYGPGSPAAKQAPQLAEEILRYAEAAYAVLKTAAGRRQYRQEKFPTVRLDYSAQIVNAQAQLAEMRGELSLAIEMMEGAIELHPTEEHLATLRRMQGKAAK